MFAWLRRFQKPTASARHFGYRDGDDVIRVELKEFAPGILPFLSINALSQLSLYEAATQAVLGAPSLAAKGAIAEVAAAALEKHKRFAAELKKRGIEPHRAMAPYVRRAGDLSQRLSVDDWHQHVLTVLLVSGIVESFMANLAAGLKDGYKKEAIEILQDDSARRALHSLLAAEIAADPRVADKLALWGRRLVGDTLLLAQDVLMLSENREFVHAEMDPILTDITGGHMQRMDSLGLTA